MTSLELILDQHPFFRDIETRHVQKIAEHASYISFKEGQLVFRQGEPAHTFYIIDEGKVALEVFSPGYGPISILTLGHGDVLGWSWLFDPPLWHFDIRALEPVRAIALNGDSLRAQCEADHELGYQLMQHSVRLIEQRLQATMIQLLDMYSVR